MPRNQEFDTREASEESVAKYYEGYFMGNKVRIELFHGGGRKAKFAGDPALVSNAIRWNIGQGTQNFIWLSYASD